jgi:beta-glucosidase
MKKVLFLFGILPAMAAYSQQQTATVPGTIVSVSNKGGQGLKYSSASGIQIIKEGANSFKDLNKNGKLDKYEDWRLPVEVRAKDLAAKMTVEQIAGLMLYSRHQPIPSAAGGPFAGTYQGKTFC